MCAIRWLFPLLAVAALGGCGSGTAIHEAPKVPLEVLLNAVPEELRFDHSKVSHSENRWTALAKVYRSTPRLGQDSVMLFQESSLSVDPLSAETKSTLNEVFARFEPYMRSTEEHLAGANVAAVDLLPNDSLSDVHIGMRVQLALFNKRAALNLIEGNVDRALNDYEVAIAIVKQLGSSQGPLYYAVITSSLWTRVCREIRWAARHPNMTNASLRRLLELLPEEAQIREDFKHSIRAELYYFIKHEVQRLRGPGGNSLAQRDASESYRDFDSGWDQADEVAALVLDGHTHPFDRRATVASAALVYGEYLRNIDRSWTDQVRLNTMLVSLIRDWPISRLNGSLDGENGVDEELLQAQRKLLTDVNPYGKFAVWFFSQISDQSVTAPFRTQAETGGTKLVLAARLFKKRIGTFPKELRELTDKKILPDLPHDPFNGSPYTYDLAHRTVKSIGPGQQLGAGSVPNAARRLRQDYEWSFDDLPVADVQKGSPSIPAVVAPPGPKRRSTGQAFPALRAPAYTQ